MSGILFRFCGTVIAMPLAAWILPGVHTANDETAWIVGVILGFAYLLLRPIAKLILTPFNCLTFGLASFLVDIGLVQLATSTMEGFHMDNFWWTVASALLVVVLREVFGRLSGNSRQ